MRTVYTVAVVSLVALAGCASDYAYVPAERANANVMGRPSGFYEIPEKDPKGDVRIASFGVSKVTTQSGTIMRAMHVRMVVSNDSQDQTWTIDTRNQLAQFRSGEQVGPAWAQSDQGGLPLVQVGPQQKRTVDLFYPLPAEAQKARKIPEFDVLWRVQTPEQLVSERTPFQRLYVAPMYAGGYYGWGGPWGYGYGPYGWYGRGWGPAYLGSPGWWW